MTGRIRKYPDSWRAEMDSNSQYSFSSGTRRLVIHFLSSFRAVSIPAPFARCLERCAFEAD
jgi:hypothetical protein